MPTTQKSQQKQMKATQKVGGSAKKPVTKAMEGGSTKKPAVTKAMEGGKAAPSKGKTTRGGSAKGGGMGLPGSMKDLLPVTKKKTNHLEKRIGDVEKSIGDVEKSIGDVNDVVESINTNNEIHSKKIEILTAQIKAIFSFLDEETQNKINDQLNSIGNHIQNVPIGNYKINLGK